MLGLKTDWVLEPEPRDYALADYEGCQAKWCPGCGDHSVLNAVQRLCRDERLPPEQTVFVSGIGCSSRFPHYMKTYGFHGLHGRALPVASGIRARRPDLNIFVATGDGDCCSIGTAHWIHALRYNMKMVVMMFDNNIYGLTKKQTSPTTRRGRRTNTHPDGAFLSPMNPITVSLGVPNASFIAQTVDWNPPHLYATLREAFHHPGFAFVRVMQRCPHFTGDNFELFQTDPSKILLMTHPDGVPVDDALIRTFTTRVEHDPADRMNAFNHAMREDVLPIGLFYRDEEAEHYDSYTREGLDTTPAEKVEAMDKLLDLYCV
ncbi:MAG: thiamine pyrophosphate-dependent enzyme [Acidobacteriota bacterium]|nr:thiamine pyrophosphate-dependent enzyme [Acidobacteriota bacterium]